MGVTTREFWNKFISILPLLMLFFISLNGSSIINMKFFSINILYILVYYWVLRQPQTLGYGLIFLAGVISDIVNGFSFKRINQNRNNQNATKLAEKYTNLAKEALTNGDKILYENYLQHADHFTRIFEEKENNKTAVEKSTEKNNSE